MDRLYPEARHCAGMAEGVTGLATPRARGRRARASSPSAKIDLGGKTLEQYLEQLRVAVALREREGAALGAYLARV